MRLKYLVTINDRVLAETTSPDMEFDYIDISTVGRGHLVENPQRQTFATAPSRARRLVRAGDTIVSTVRTYLRAVLPITDETSGCVVSTGFAVLTPGRGVDPGFLAWLVQSDVVVEEIVRRSVGVSYPSVAPSEIGEILVDVPEVREQRLIAARLAGETRRLEALVDAKMRLRSALATQRAATVERGVAGSFVERARTKSTIPWLSTLPEGWSAARLKYVARLGSGHTPSRQHPEWWEDCTIPWITTGDVHRLRDDRLETLEETEHHISELGLANSAAVLHPNGTVVLSRTASVGLSAIMGREMATSQDFATWTCSEWLLPEFLLYCLRAMRADLLGRLAQGSTHQTIYMPDIERIMVPLPPLAQQRAIVAEIRRRVAPIDRLVDALDAQLPKLAEYRRALITEAVTGRATVAA